MMNKKLFMKQIKTIVISIIVMIVVALFANYLKEYGFSKLFTTHLYEDAFAISKYDKFLIKVFASFLEGVALITCYTMLSYNKDIAEIEKEEEEFFRKFERGEF